MKKIACIIIDDEPNAIKLLESHILKMPTLELKYICYNGVEGLAYIKTNPVDLIFLDINMPLLNGMELIRILSSKQKIIFTTAHSDYAADSYEYNALDYILKPISFERFMKAVTKAENYFELQSSKDEFKTNEDPYMFIKTDRRLIKINFSEILFFEAQKEYVNVHTATEKYLFYKRMKELEEQLPVNFIRIHHSYIINLNYIARIEGATVTINNKEIPIGSSFKDEFQKRIKSRTF
ncbi:MAG: LytR/AlgR family response regulator transcription factor [Flavisolibacter sp.]